jgi:hypothetical protein
MSINSQLSRQHMFQSASEVQDKAVTVRPSSTALFCIDSRDRYKTVIEEQNANKSAYDFTIYKNESLLNGFFTRIGLTEIVFPYYIPNINDKTNTILMIYDGGAEVPVVLKNGFYNPTDLAAALQQALITAGADAATTVTYTAFGNFEIDASTGHDIILFSTVEGPNEWSLFDLLGGNLDWVTAAQVLGGTITRCRYTEYIDITCSQLTYNQDLKDGSSAPIVRDMVARVYIETENDQVAPVWNGTKVVIPTVETIPGCYPFTIYRQFKTPKMIMWNNTQPIGNLKIELFDSRGNPLTMSNYLADSYAPDWRATFLISEN